MTEEIAVRVGTPADLDQVMELARMMHAEIGIATFNEAKVLPDIWAALNCDRGIMGLIGEPGDTIQGGIILRLGQVFYSDDEVLEERGLFIHPDFRSAKGGRAARLCEFAKKAAEGMGMPLVIGVMNDVRAKAKMRLYDRQFGEPAGAFYLWRPSAPALKQDEAA